MEWKTGTIKEFAEVKGGKRLPKGKTLISTRNTHPYIRIRDLGKSKLLQLNSEYEYVDDETQKEISRYIVHEGDILISVVGTVGLVGIVDKSLDGANQTENCDKLTNLHGIDRNYIYYYLISKYGQDEIKKGTVGAVQPKLPLKNIQDLPIHYPPIDVQRKIGAILSVLDSKIETNNQINGNLLEQARSLYKSWFIDFEPFGGIRPQSWKNGIVQNLASDIICGKTPSTKIADYYGSDVPFVTIPDMHDCVYALNTERSLSSLGAATQKNKTLPKNSICVSCIGTAGLVVLIAKESQTNQQINSIIPKDEVSPYYVFLLMETMKERINSYGQSGSTIVNLNKAQFGNLEALIPSEIDLKRFNDIVSSLFEKILINQKENNSLCVLRDSLLPKLMSGELDFSELDL